MTKVTIGVAMLVTHAVRAALGMHDHPLGFGRHGDLRGPDPGVTCSQHAGHSSLHPGRPSTATPCQ